MTALMSYDWEFTHAVPGLGAGMQFGAVIVPWDSETMQMVHHDVPGLKLKVVFPVTNEHKASDWVQKNQTGLLEQCRAMDPASYAEKCQKVKDFIRKAVDLYGGPVIPAGWCTGSDYAYLLKTLWVDHDLVHYSGVDLKSIAMALMGTYDPGDSELREFLGVDPPVNEHDALADAEYQLRMILAACKLCSKNAR